MPTSTFPAVAAYTFLQPLRRVLRRVNNPAGQHYHDENLDCGHTLLKQRSHARGNGVRYLPDHRRCPECPPDPPPLLGVEVVLDEAVPYAPGDGRRIGFHYVNESGRLSLKPTYRVRMHPAYRATLPPGAFRRRRLKRALWEQPWACELCGASGKNPGGRATHYRVKHGKGAK